MRVGHPRVGREPVLPSSVGPERVGIRWAPPLRRDIRDLIGVSPAMAAVRALIRRVAPHDLPILIEGERGTGKRLVAEIIHSLSPFREGGLAVVECAALADELLGLALFGAVPGLCARCPQGLSGILERAAGGTLFLRGGESMPAWMVHRLVQTVERRALERLGESMARPLRARLLVARTLARGPARAGEEVSGARLDRLSGGFPLTLPPLRERREDVGPLSWHFLDGVNRECGTRVRGFSAPALARLAAYDWPGNLRELRGVVRLAAQRAGRVILPEHLPARLRGPVQARQGEEPRR